jgi:hypothetical protein
MAMMPSVEAGSRMRATPTNEIQLLGAMMAKKTHTTSGADQRSDLDSPEQASDEARRRNSFVGLCPPAVAVFDLTWQESSFQPGTGQASACSWQQCCFGMRRLNRRCAMSRYIATYPTSYCWNPLARPLCGQVLHLGGIALIDNTGSGQDRQPAAYCVQVGVVQV